MGRNHRIRDILHPKSEPRGLNALREDTVREIVVVSDDGDQFVPDDRVAEIAVTMALFELGDVAGTGNVEVELARRAAALSLTLRSALEGGFPWEYYTVKAENVDQAVHTIIDGKVANG